MQNGDRVRVTIEGIVEDLKTEDGPFILRDESFTTLIKVFRSGADAAQIEEIS